jgi:hypothetical protein
MRSLGTVAMSLCAVWSVFQPVPSKADYSIRPLVKLGDTVGGVVSRSSRGYFEVGTLNDNGQLIFVTANAAGGEALLQYTDGGFQVIAAGGGDGPNGKWRQDLTILSPVSMNQVGNAIFAATLPTGNRADLGTFKWDSQKKQILTVAVPGAEALPGQKFTQGGGSTSVISNREDIALVGSVDSPVDDIFQQRVFLDGVLWVGADGKLQRIALPGDRLEEPPGGRIALYAGYPSVSDDGRVALLIAQRRPPAAASLGASTQSIPSSGEVRVDYVPSGYLWENGRLTLMAEPGMQAPGGGSISYVRGVRVNNQNRDAVVIARLNDPDSGPEAIYRFTGSQLVPVVVPGKDMPGGGKFRGIQPYGFSAANSRGQYAFLATLEDGTQAAYLMDAEGHLSLLLKSGETAAIQIGETHVSTRITSVGPGSENSLGVSLNGRGQVALTISVAGGPHMLVLLTPSP